MKRWSAISGSAFAFVIAMGIVNLFADTTYEGAASINGPFMATLGAGAATISIVAGLGEFLGYALRSVAGYVSDKTGRYWLVTFVGYAINLLAVPALVLAGSWLRAELLILAERIGRALRKPTLVPALLALVALIAARIAFPLPARLEEGRTRRRSASGARTACTRSRRPASRRVS